MGPDEVRMIVTYKGVPADKLSREELIVAFTWAVKELQQERNSHMETLEMEKLFDEARTNLRHARNPKMD